MTEWDWPSFEQFTLTMISQLMTDYFIDGRLRQEAKKSVTFYTLLKKARKEFKRRWLNTVLEH